MSVVNGQFSWLSNKVNTVNTFFLLQILLTCKLVVSGFNFMSVCSENVCVLVYKVTHLLKICKVTFGYNQRKKKRGDEAFRINRRMVQMIRADPCLLYRVGIGQQRISWLYNLIYDHHILITTSGKWFDDDKCIHSTI